MSLFTKGFKNKPSSTGKFFKSQVSESSVEELKSIPLPPSITLDDEQEVIVNSTDSNIVVVAGAGSGKTRVLTERIRHLINDIGVSAHNIVAITFTNMAADEMKLRLSDIDTIGDAFIGTIHSFANRIMKESGERYTLFNDELDIMLHKELIAKYCNHLTMDRYLEYKDLETQVDMGKANEKLLQEFFYPSEEADYRLLHLPYNVVYDDIKNGTHNTFGESIATLCKKRDIITFNELLIKAKTYFEKIEAKIEYVFIDEFQDVGTLEYGFIKSLNAENYFFVGDDWQSIYGFKGGNVNIFKSLVSNEDYTTYYLNNNYRNCTGIIELANSVMSQVSNKIDKNIQPMISDCGRVIIKNKNSIAGTLGMIYSSKSYKDWFILVRTNKELFEMAEYCERFSIPYTTFKREGMSLTELNREMNSNRVKILTVHTSKGLEIDNVVLYGNSFQIAVPYYRLNPDERKVMYVGVTRAKKQLIIHN